MFQVEIKGAHVHLSNKLQPELPMQQTLQSHIKYIYFHDQRNQKIMKVKDH